MNEDYVKAFIDNFKRKFADVHAANVELETLIQFKDKEIGDLKAQIASLEVEKFNTIESTDVA